MNKETLLELIDNSDECEWIEFKTNYPADKYYMDIGEYISALSNSAALHKQTFAYMIWGVENNTKKIIGTLFNYDIEINGSEVFKHYLARNLDPHISFKFEEIYIGKSRIVCLTIPSSKEIITEFDHERFIRIGSSKERLRKYPKIEAELWAELSGTNDIANIESRRNNLTFQILKNYLSTHNYHYNDSTFLDNLGFKTKSGNYNLLAELLADNNDIVINVATFATNDKTEYLKRNEFGGKCLLLAMEQAKNYIESINQIYVDTTIRPRKEKPMINMDAFKEAWYNACVHYKWSEANNPGIYVYSDRLEIESFGGIPVDLSKKQFLQGVSKPVNKRLFEIFKTCGFAEESGHGVPTVTKAYGNDSYIFDGKFIKVVIPFNISNKSKTTKETTKEIINTTQETTKEIINTTQETTQEKIINLLRANALLTRKDLSIILKLSEDGIQYHLNQLKKKGIIEHKGSTKSGYWLVKD